MSIVEASISVPAEHETNVFGQFDQHIKKMERALNITVVNRDGVLKIIGGETAVNKARKIFEQLIELSKHGNIIQEQNVDYAIALSYEDKEEALSAIDQDTICHTINGKPIKPKTLGQKQYVDAIRKKMIVFGIGPAGTGKTYLAMAMAIQAFKNDEVGQDHSDQARDRGRRKAWISAGGSAKQDRSVSASAL